MKFFRPKKNRRAGRVKPSAYARIETQRQQEYEKLKQHISEGIGGLDNAKVGTIDASNICAGKIYVSEEAAKLLRSQMLPRGWL